MAYINRNKIPAILRKGDKGDNAFIRYSANANGTDMTEEWSEGQNYIGFATGQTAPTEKEAYTWVLLPEGKQGIQGEKCEQGEKGEQGDDYILTEADKIEIGEQVEKDIIGDIETALDGIIAIQNTLIGGTVCS